MVCGLPRSRTAWFSVWLNAHGCPAIHEMFAKVEGLQNYRLKLERYADCCTYAGFIPSMPVDRRVIVHRFHGDVADSLRAMSAPEAWLGDLEEQSYRIMALKGLHIGYGEINGSLRRIHEYLKLPVPFDPYVSEMLTELKVTMRPLKLGSRSLIVMKNLDEYRALYETGTAP